MPVSEAQRGHFTLTRASKVVQLKQIIGSMQQPFLNAHARSFGYKSYLTAVASLLKKAEHPGVSVT
jgi:hypothetical protein